MFDPPFDERARQDDFTRILAQRYDAPITLLPPGVELENMWWAGRMSHGAPDLVNSMSTPDKVDITLSYKGGRFRRYRDRFSLDTEMIKGTTYSVSSDSAPGRMKTIAQSIKKLADQGQETNRLLKTIASRAPRD